MRRVPLGEIVDFYSGGTPSKAQPEFWHGNVPWFSAKDLKAPRLPDSIDHVSESVFETTSLRKLPAGTIALVVRGMILAHTLPISILDVDGAINQDLKALIPRQEIDPTFLAAMLRAQAPSILAEVSTAGHGTKKLDSRILENIEIPLPPINEQRRIVAILDQADAIRTKRRRALAYLDTLTQSIFQDMFAEVPWDSSLGRLSSIQIGPFGSLLHQADYIDGGVSVLNPTHIQQGRLSPDSNFSISEEKASSLTIYRIRESDVILGRRGEMGRAGIASHEHVGMLCGTGSLILRPLDTDSTWLHAVATSARMKAHLERESLGATLPNLNAKIVSSAPTPKVPRHAQERFALLIEGVRLRRTAVARALGADDELFDSLQSRAFRGGL